MMRSTSTFSSVPVNSPFTYVGRKAPLDSIEDRKPKLTPRPKSPVSYIDSFSLENLPPPPPSLDLLDVIPAQPNVPAQIPKPVPNKTPVSQPSLITSPKPRVISQIPSSQSATQPQNNGKRYCNPDSCDELSPSSDSDTDSTDSSSSSDEGDSKDVNVRHPRAPSPSDSSSYTTTTDEEEEREYDMSPSVPALPVDPLAKMFAPLRSDDEPVETREISNLSQLAKFTSEETRHTDRGRGIPGLQSLAHISIPTRSSKPAASDKVDSPQNRSTGPKLHTQGKDTTKSPVLFKSRSKGLPIIFERSESVESSAGASTATSLVISKSSPSLCIQEEAEESEEGTTHKGEDAVHPQVIDKAAPVITKPSLIVKRVEASPPAPSGTPPAPSMAAPSPVSQATTQNKAPSISSSSSASQHIHSLSPSSVSTTKTLHDAWSTSELIENDAIRSSGSATSVTTSQNVTPPKWRGYGRPQFALSSVASSGNTNLLGSTFTSKSTPSLQDKMEVKPSSGEAPTSSVKSIITRFNQDNSSKSPPALSPKPKPPIILPKPSTAVATKKVNSTLPPNTDVFANLPPPPPPPLQETSIDDVNDEELLTTVSLSSSISSDQRLPVSINAGSKLPQPAIVIPTKPIPPQNTPASTTATAKINLAPPKVSQDPSMNVSRPNEPPSKESSQITLQSSDSLSVSKEKQAEWKRLRDKSATQRSNEIADNIIVMDRAIDRVTTHISSIDTTLGKMHNFNTQLYKTLETLSDDDVELDLEAVQLDSREVQTEPLPAPQVSSKSVATVPNTDTYVTPISPPKSQTNSRNVPVTVTKNLKSMQTAPSKRQTSSSESSTSSSYDTSDSSEEDSKHFDTAPPVQSSTKLPMREKIKQVENALLSSKMDSSASTWKTPDAVPPKPSVSKAASPEVPSLSKGASPPVPTPRRSTNDPGKVSSSKSPTPSESVSVLELSSSSLASSKLDLNKGGANPSPPQSTSVESSQQDTKRATLFKKKAKPVYGSKHLDSTENLSQKSTSSSKPDQPMLTLRADVQSQPNLRLLANEASSIAAGKGVKPPSSVISSISETPIMPVRTQGVEEPKPPPRMLKPKLSGPLAASKSVGALNESNLLSKSGLDAGSEEEDDFTSGSSLEDLNDVEHYQRRTGATQHGRSRGGRVDLIGGSLASLNTVGHLTSEPVGGISDAEIILRLRRYLDTGQQKRVHRLLGNMAGQERLQILVDNMDDTTYQLLEVKLHEMGLSLSAFLGEGDSESIFNRATSISDLRNHLQPGVRSTETHGFSLSAGSQLSQQQHQFKTGEPGMNFLTGSNSVGTILRTIYCPLDAVEEPFPPIGVPAKPVPPQFLKSVIVQQAAMDKIDAVAQKVSTMDPTTFTELIRNLTQECSNDVEKVRALFRWITLFDMTYVDFDPHAPPDSLIGMLRGIKCGQVSNNELFHRMCRYAGIFCEYVSGYSKGAGYRPGMVLKDNRMFRNIWCAVYVAKGWRFVNCNWGARYLSTLISDTHNYASSVTGTVNPRMGTLLSAASIHSLNSSVSSFASPSLRGGTLASVATMNGTPQQVRYRCDEFYFLTDPGQHIFEHFPDNKRWQLLKKCITMEQFMRMPIVKSPFFNAGMSFKKNYADTLITKNGSITIKMYMPRFVGVSCTLENRTDLSTIKGVTLVRIVDDLVIITSAPAQPGKYYLNIYIRENWQNDETSTRELGCSFQVHCSEHNYDRLMIGRYPSELDEGYLGRTPHAQRYGVVLGDSHNRSVDPYIVWNEKDTLTIPFVISPGLKISHQMRSYDRPGQQAVNCSSYAFLQSKANKSFYCVRFPVDAFYFLVIYAAPLRWEEKQSNGDYATTTTTTTTMSGGISCEELECVYYLLIDCRKAQEGIPPFPRMSSLWCSSYLAEPTQQHLLLNKRYKFRVEAPLFHKVSVVINGGMQWIDLKQQKSNGQWVGKVHVGDQLGELSVYGQYRSSVQSIVAPDEEANEDEDGEFEKLLTYVLVQKIT